MPFTPSHAVVALPFIRTPLVPAAIAIGAMTPDLPLFLRGLPLPYGRTHDIAWLPVTVLVALALLLVWRCLLRPAARELSPARLAARLPRSWDAGAVPALRETFGGDSRRDRARPWTAVPVLVLSLLIGVVTHIVWDLFTHEGRWGVEILPVLDERWGPLVGYKWLQHGSSVLGLAIIAVWAIVWLSKRTTPSAAPRVLPDAVRWVWWASLPTTLAIAWVIGLVQRGPVETFLSAAQLAYIVLPPACAVWGLLTLVLAIVVQLRRAHR